MFVRWALDFNERDPKESQSWTNEQSRSLCSMHIWRVVAFKLGRGGGGMELWQRAATTDCCFWAQSERVAIKYVGSGLSTRFPCMQLAGLENEAKRRWGKNSKYLWPKMRISFVYFHCTSPSSSPRGWLLQLMNFTFSIYLWGGEMLCSGERQKWPHYRYISMTKIPHDLINKQTSANTRDQFRAADTQVFAVQKKNTRSQCVYFEIINVFAHILQSSLLFLLLLEWVSEQIARTKINLLFLFIISPLSRARIFPLRFSLALAYTHVVVVVVSFFKNISDDLTGWNVGRAALWRSPIFTFFPI